MGSTDEQVQAAFVDAKSYNKFAKLSSFTIQQPQHNVCITQPYWLDEGEVTNEAYDAFVADDGYSKQNLWSEAGWKWLERQAKKEPDTSCSDISSDPQQPRVCVTYYEAEAYAKWRNARLPTEAEWEYAARGKDGLIYPWGNDWDKTKANTYEDGPNKSTPVCSYPKGKSWIGACDMVGNAREWVSDWYSKYTSEAMNDPKGPASGSYHVIRGGTSCCDIHYRGNTAYRITNHPTIRDGLTGFRLASSVSP